MSHFLIRFNKTRGQPGRGTMDHVWRVFIDGKEYLAKQIEINVPSRGVKSGEDWNIECKGRPYINRETATITVEHEDSVE